LAYASGEGEFDSLKDDDNSGGGDGSDDELKEVSRLACFGSAFEAGLLVLSAVCGSSTCYLQVYKVCNESTVRSETSVVVVYYARQSLKGTSPIMYMIHFFQINQYLVQAHT
jgi:hypothetical protein